LVWLVLGWVGLGWVWLGWIGLALALCWVRYLFKS
jgi:hypothetical protein